MTAARVRRHQDLLAWWRRTGSLFSNRWYDLEPQRLGEEMQAEGHASPDRIPPPDLANLVTQGRK